MAREWSAIALITPPTQDGLPRALRLTAHAVERYQERWRPTWAHPDAARELTSEVRAAVFKERDGQALIYRTPRGALLSVADNGTVMTVLPMGAAKTVWRPQKPPRERKPVAQRVGRGRDDRMTKVRGRQKYELLAERAAQDVIDWNRQYPVGTLVVVTLGDGEMVLTKTTSTARVNCDHASVQVELYASSMDLTRVRPATAEELLHAASEI